MRRHIMKNILSLLAALIFPALAMGATYTVSAVPLTMHVGDRVPPLIFTISPYAGSYAANFTGQPTLATTATSASPVGTYPIKISAGSMTSRGNTLTFLNSILTVIPVDGIGAQINDRVPHPSGITAGPSYAMQNVTANGVVGDCATDNTEALNTLLKGARSTTGRGYFRQPIHLLFPPGCYLVSGPLNLYGNIWTLEGSGPAASYIKLAPNSAAFNTGTTASLLNVPNVGGNANFQEYIYNLGIDIGVGNPDVEIVNWIANNTGAIENVRMWVEDSRCIGGIGLHNAYPGPTLIKNVAIYGCAQGIRGGQIEYHATIEGLTTEGQTQYGISVQSIPLSIRHWLSANTITAYYAAGPGTSNVIIDSEILGGSGSTAGIINGEGYTLYLRNLRASGYSPTESDSGAGTTVNRTGNIAEAWTGTAQSLFNSTQPPGSLNLPESETPVASDPDVGVWTQLGSDPATWSATLADSSVPTAYSAAGVYRLSPNTVVTVTVPDTINHIQCYGAIINPATSRINFSVAGTSTMPLVIDRCQVGFEVTHTGSRPVVIRHAALRGYTSTAGAGNLYIEDDVISNTGITFYASQSVWARQLDLEPTEQAANKFVCTGCTLWVLGYKTERGSASVTIREKGKAEIFGFFFYPINIQPRGIAPIVLSDSSLFATGVQAVYGPGRGTEFFVSEFKSEFKAQSKSESQSESPGSSLSLPAPNPNKRQLLNMYYSFGGEPAPPRTLRAVPN
jgi:hypothetical protein